MLTYSLHPDKDVQYIPFRLPADRMSYHYPQLILCYQNSFAGWPWYEFRKCANPECPYYWGNSDEDLMRLQELDFKHCGRDVVEFWPYDTVKNDIWNELTLPGASCWLALHNDVVVGFCWGYPMTPADLAVKLERPTVLDAIHRNFGPQDRVAYLDDVGVDPPYRGNKLLARLFNHRLHELKTQGPSIAVFRTQQKPPTVTYTLYGKHGFSVIDEYPETPKHTIRVVMARNILDFEGLPENFPPHVVVDEPRE